MDTVIIAFIGLSVAFGGLALGFGLLVLQPPARPHPNAATMNER